MGEGGIFSVLIFTFSELSEFSVQTCVNHIEKAVIKVYLGVEITGPFLDFIFNTPLCTKQTLIAVIF